MKNPIYIILVFTFILSVVNTAILVMSLVYFIPWYKQNSPTIQELPSMVEKFNLLPIDELSLIPDQIIQLRNNLNEINFSKMNETIYNLGEIDFIKLNQTIDKLSLFLNFS